MADLNIRVTPGVFRWGLAALLLSVSATELSTESVTLNTYYPAPSGVYTQMITTSNTYLARDGGNVGIGTTAPGAKLEVVGNMRIADGTQGAGKILTSDSNGTTSWQASASMPPGAAVLFFNVAACPPGWSEVSSARGRYLVGGSPGVTVGTPLANGENRAVGSHRHPIVFAPGFEEPQAPRGSGPIGSGDQHLKILDPTAGGSTNAPYIQVLICQKI